MQENTESWLLQNIENLTPLQYRTLNRYYLHPQDKRSCNKCFEVFCGIRENFHVKKYHGKGDDRITTYNTFCKKCASIRNLRIRNEIKNDDLRYIHSLCIQVKHRAKSEGVDFDLDDVYLKNLLEAQEYKCAYTGQDISFNHVAKTRNRPHNLMGSLDRKIPLNGYIKGNVVWTVFYVNRSKNDLTDSQFLEMCKSVVNNLK